MLLIVICYMYYDCKVDIEVSYFSTYSYIILIFNEHCYFPE